MAALNIPIDAKVNPALPQLLYIMDSDGSFIGMQHPNGKVTFFPASDWDEGITATAAGTQASSVPLRYKNSRVTIVVTGGDGVTLPIGQEGMSIIVTNSSAGVIAMNVFPGLGQAINLLATDAALSVAANKTVTFSYSGSKWQTNLTA